MIEVIHAVSVMNRAGQETLLMNILRNIDSRKVHFSFLCSLHQQGDYDDEIRSLGGTIYYLPENKFQNKGLLRYVGEINAYMKFFAEHKEFDILHIHNYHAFDASLQIFGARLGGMRKCVVHSHNSSAMHVKLHKIFRKILPLTGAKMFACSKSAADWMYGKISDRAIIIQNGIILDDFRFSEEKRNKLRKQLNLTEEQFVVGHIGRFNHQKNHHFLIKIFAKIVKKNPQAKLLLVGVGDLQSEIKNMVQSLGLQDNVIFLGIREDIPELLSVFDVLLFPSFFEGLSVVLVEAQASGLPCVISDTISSEINLTESITMASLKDSPDKWADLVLQKQKEGRKDNYSRLYAAGYDIRLTAKQLTEIYSQYKFDK